MKKTTKRKLSSAQTELLLKAASKLLLAVSFFGLFFILYQVTFDKPLYVFFMLTLQHWLIFAVGLTGCVILDVAATHPELRFYFTHLEKKGQQLKMPQQMQSASAQATVSIPSAVSPEDQKNFEALQQKYPNMFKDMIEKQAEALAQQKLQQQPKRKLPLY